MAVTLDSIKREITTAKTLITKLINKINSTDNLSVTCMTSKYQDICQRFDVLKSKQEVLLNMIDVTEVDALTDEVIDYQHDVQIKLSEIESRINQNNANNIEAASSGGDTNKTDIQIKMPELKLPRFTDNATNIFSFVQFKSSFMNALNALPDMTNTTKFLYLRSQLSGRAYSLIENLAVQDNTYETAMNMLDKEFMNRTEIFVATMSDFMNTNPVSSLEAACDVVLQFKTHLTELRKLQYDFDGNEAAVEFVSMVLRQKLPSFFTREIGRICDKANPTYNDIFDKYVQVRQLLSDGKKEHKVMNAPKLASSYNKRVINGNERKFVSDLAKNKIPSNASSGKICKFCESKLHYSSGCNVYINAEGRVKRATELKLCTRCLSAKHSEPNCSGKFGKIPFACKICAQYTHATPMCKNAASVNVVNE